MVLKLAPAGTTSGERVLKEGALLADLSHPRLPRVHARFDGVEGLQRDRVSGFAMPWIDGDRLDVARPRELPAVITCFREVAEAVAFLHARRVLHLDIKPSNVLLTATGAVLLDLGTAHHADSSSWATGGTLGYAAPEVLRHVGPTTASDVYALGVLLYELLAGRSPFLSTNPQELRHEVLADDAIPLRAVAPHVPTPLADLIQEMMQAEAILRPTLPQVGATLDALGFPHRPSPPGSPPLLSRESELEELRIMLEEDTAPVAVVGPPGMGRDRVIRHAADHFRIGPQGGTVDLSGVTDPVQALRQLVTLGEPRSETAPDDELAILQRLERPLSWTGRVYLGRAEDQTPEMRQRLERLQEPLAEAGLGMVWAAVRSPSGCRPFLLRPLDENQLERIAMFRGASPGASLRHELATCGGNPGALLRTLLGEQVDLDERLGSVLERLRTLPVGVPGAVVARLPRAWRDTLEELVQLGLVQRRADGAWLIDGARSPAVVDPELQGWIEPLPADLPAHWQALYLCRVGKPEEALALLDQVLQVPELTTERSELLEALARHGSDRAARQLALLRCAEADYDGALAAADLIRQAPTLALRLIVLHTANRLDEADALLAAHPPPYDAETWRAVATLALTQGALDRAEEALQAVEALAPKDPANLAPKLGLWVVYLQQGRDIPELVPTVEAALNSDQPLPQGTLARCGRALLRSGQVELACRVLEQAARVADVAGNARAATLTRINLANALLSTGRGQEARRYYREALVSARALSHQQAVIRVLYSMCELELRANRLSEAERWLHEYLETARDIPDPEVQARGRILQAAVAEFSGRVAEVPAMLGPLLDQALPVDVQESVRRGLALAYLSEGQPEVALEHLRGSEPRRPAHQRDFAMLRGRAYLAIARRHLARARALVPDDEPETQDKGTIGEVLLASAGEDLDPNTFEQRRRDLDLAARMLRGEGAARAATLRDRLLAAPGAGLARIADLLESVRDPKGFPKTLARIVGEALGANRVLILMRIPGLGRQLGFLELTQEEVAGISEEVMRRIVRADDVWLAEDAFADPAIREVSATIRTFEIRSVLAVAIPGGEHAMGALYVDDLHRSNRFSDEDVRVLQRLARAASHLITAVRPGHVPAPPLAEPEDLFGVLLTDPQQVSLVRETIDMLRGSRDQHTNLLITGATGTGKTWLARRIAREVLGLEGLVEHTIRHTEPDKLVSTLAGTRRGEFTGAIHQAGAIQQALAERKALFLDEIQALDDDGQTALLPLLELPHRRFGGLTGPAGDIHKPLVVIMGTNVEVSGGRWRQHFRQDLWFRMSQLHIHLPTLAERGPEVVYRHLGEFLAHDGVDQPPEEVLSPAALQLVASRPWTGNLRQLASAAKEIAFRYKRASEALSRDEVEGLRAFQQDVESAPAMLVDRPRPPVALNDPFLAELWRLLKRHGWNQSEVARHLNCHVSRIHRALKRAGLLDEVRILRARHVERSSG